MRRVRRVAIPHEEEILALRNQVATLTAEKDAATTRMKVAEEEFTVLRHVVAELRTKLGLSLMSSKDEVRFDEERDVRALRTRIVATNLTTGMRAEAYINDDLRWGSGGATEFALAEIRSRLYEKVTKPVTEDGSGVRTGRISSEPSLSQALVMSTTDNLSRVMDEAIHACIRLSTELSSSYSSRAIRDDVSVARQRIDRPSMLSATQRTPSEHDRQDYNYCDRIEEDQ